MDKDAENPPRPGPEPERLKIEGDWEDAVKHALGKPKPPEGWPEPEPGEGETEQAEDDTDPQE